MINDIIVIENNKENNLIVCAVIQDGLAGGYDNGKMVYFTDEKKKELYPSFINFPVVIEHANQAQKENIFGVIVDVFQNLHGIVINNKLAKEANGKWYAKSIIDKTKMSKEDVLSFKGVSTGYNLLKYRDKGFYNSINLEEKKLILVEEIEPRHLALVMNPRYEECEGIITNSIGNNQASNSLESENENNDIVMNDETKKEISSIVSQEISNLKSSMIEEIKNSVRSVINEAKEEDKEKDKKDETKMENKKMYNFDGVDYTEEDIKNFINKCKNSKDEEDEEGEGKMANKKAMKNSTSNQSGLDLESFSAEVINSNNKNIKTFESESKAFEEQYRIQILNNYKK